MRTTKLLFLFCSIKYIPLNFNHALSLKNKLGKWKYSPLYHFLHNQFERVCFLIKSISNSTSLSLKNQQKQQIKFQTKLKLNFKHTNFNKIKLTMKIKNCLGSCSCLISLARHLLQNVFFSTRFLHLFQIWVNLHLCFLHGNASIFDHSL